IVAPARKTLRVVLTGSLVAAAERRVGVQLSGALLLRAAKAVPETADRFDHLTRGTQLRPKALDVHVHGSGLDVRCGFPDSLQQVRTCLHAPPPLHESYEQLVF